MDKRPSSDNLLLIFSTGSPEQEINQIGSLVVPAGTCARQCIKGQGKLVTQSKEVEPKFRVPRQKGYYGRLHSQVAINLLYIFCNSRYWFILCRGYGRRPLSTVKIRGRALVMVGSDDDSSPVSNKSSVSPKLQNLSFNVRCPHTSDKLHVAG